MYVFLPLEIAVSSWFLPDVVETKNLTLEETAAIFDGEEAEKEILAAAAERDLSEKPSVEELDNADLKAWLGYLR